MGTQGSSHVEAVRSVRAGIRESGKESARAEPDRSQSRHSSASKPRENRSREKVRNRGKKPSNDRWSEGRQESGKAEDMKREGKSPEVSERDKQAEEDLWETHRAELGVWTEPMLEPCGFARLLRMAC